MDINAETERKRNFKKTKIYRRGREVRTKRERKKKLSKEVNKIVTFVVMWLLQDRPRQDKAIRRQKV